MSETPPPYRPPSEPAPARKNGPCAASANDTEASGRAGEVAPTVYVTFAPAASSLYSRAVGDA